MVQLYAPHELNENNYKDSKSTGRRKPPTVDVFNTLKLNPLIEYKVNLHTCLFSYLSYDDGILMETHLIELYTTF